MYFRPLCFQKMHNVLLCIPGTKMPALGYVFLAHTSYCEGKMNTIGTQSLQPYYQADRNHTPPCLCVSLTFSSQIPQECVSTKSPRNSFCLEDKVHYSASVPAQSAFSVQSHSCAPWVQGTWWAASPSVPLERAYRTMVLYSPAASPLFLFVGWGSGCLGWGSLR